MVYLSSSLFGLHKIQKFIYRPATRDTTMSNKNSQISETKYIAFKSDEERG